MEYLYSLIQKQLEVSDIEQLETVLDSFQRMKVSDTNSHHIKSAMILIITEEINKKTHANT